MNKVFFDFTNECIEASILKDCVLNMTIERCHVDSSLLKNDV